MKLIIEIWIGKRMAENQEKRRRITSGDKRIDRIFARIINFLNYEIEEIYLKRVLRVRHRGKSADFYGFIDDDVIYLSAAKTKHKDRRAIAKTLLHEVLHFVFCGALEHNILRLEDLAWEKLSEEQIVILKSYVPRHIVKISPEFQPCPIRS